MDLGKLTIVLFPEGTNKIKQFRVSKLLLVCLLLIFFSFTVYLCSILQEYYDMKSKIPQLAELKKINNYERKQIVYLTERINKIAQKMGELKEFDKKLKNMVNLEENPRSENKDSKHFTGIGGSEPLLAKASPSVGKAHKELIRSMHQSLEKLETEIVLEEKRKEEMHNFLEKWKTLLASTPSTWPVKGWLSSKFGYRLSPFTSEREFHQGIDVATRIGATIIAPANGIVSYTGWEAGYGKVLKIKHGYGMVTKYAHLHKILVQKGEHVSRGEKIALVGDTGQTTGPHLHYEVQVDGVAVNPLAYIRK